MIELIKDSYNFYFETTLKRADLSHTRGGLLAGAILMFFVTYTSYFADTDFSTGALFSDLVDVLIFWFTSVYVGRWILNKYITPPFTNLEMFDLLSVWNMLPTLVFGLVLSALSFFSDENAELYDVLFFGLTLVWLLIVQNRLSRMLKIKKMYISYVLLAPMLCAVVLSIMYTYVASQI